MMVESTASRFRNVRLIPRQQPPSKHDGKNDEDDDEILEIDIVDGNASARARKMDP